MYSEFMFIRYQSLLHVQEHCIITFDQLFFTSRASKLCIPPILLIMLNVIIGDTLLSCNLWEKKELITYYSGSMFIKKSTFRSGCFKPKDLERCLWHETSTPMGQSYLQQTQTKTWFIDQKQWSHHIKVAQNVYLNLKNIYSKSINSKADGVLQF